MSIAVVLEIRSKFCANFTNVNLNLCPIVVCARERAVPFTCFKQFGSKCLQIIAVHHQDPRQCFFPPCHQLVPFEEEIPKVTRWDWSSNPCTWLLALAFQSSRRPLRVTLVGESRCTVLAVGLANLTHALLVPK